MEKKQVKHHRATRKKSKKRSKFSLFKHKIADIFKEIVEAPPEPPKEVVEQNGVQEVEPIITAEPSAIDESHSEVHEPEKEVPDAQHEEILSLLNQSVARWKETGDVGLHLEAPVPMREKMRKFLSTLKSSHVSQKIQGEIQRVVQKASSLKTEKAVRQEWKEIVKKAEAASPAEREEIEKIYKELSGE